MQTCRLKLTQVELSMFVFVFEASWTLGLITILQNNNNRPAITTLITLYIYCVQSVIYHSVGRYGFT